MNLLCNNTTRCFHQKYDTKLQNMTCEWEHAEDCSHCVKDEFISFWKEQLKKVYQCPQRQDSITDQMIDLNYIANKFGFYDAADYIKRVFIERK